MENVNYNEKVLLPFLEKKCKDLLNLNFVLEAKLVVEQNKVKDFESHIQNESDQVQRLSNDFQRIQNERNKFESERNELLNKCIREESLKNNAISEYNSLNAKYNELLEKTKLLEEESKKKSVKKVTNTPVMI